MTILLKLDQIPGEMNILRKNNNNSELLCILIVYTGFNWANGPCVEPLESAELCLTHQHALQTREERPLKQKFKKYKFK